MKLERFGVFFGVEEGERAAEVLAEAREDITPPIIAMPIVPAGYVVRIVRGFAEMNRTMGVAYLNRGRSMSRAWTLECSTW